MRTDYNAKRRSFVLRCNSAEFQHLWDSIARAAPTEAFGGIRDVAAFTVVDETSLTRPALLTIVAKCAPFLGIVIVLAAGLVKLAEFLP